MIKILMVCLGNICRSPLAEEIMRHKLNKAGVANNIDSAGTGAWHAGEKPDERSMRVAQKHGLDISHQRARKIRNDDFEEFDYIFTMDRSVHRNVLSLEKKNGMQKNVHLFLSYAGIAQADVPDPYTRNDKDFEEVYKLLDSACESIVQKLLRP